MTSIREIRNEKIREKYREKALFLNVSPYMLNLHVNKYSMNIIKIVKEAATKEELDNILLYEMIKTEGHDFYDYSILVGLHYGVYNLYCSNYLSNVLIKKVLKTNPNVENTKKIFNTYIKEITVFLKDKYNIEESTVVNIINKMFGITEDYSLYNEKIVKDINKILMGIELKFSKEKIDKKSDDVRNSILLGEVIDYYNDICKQKKEIPSILPKR